MGLAGRLLATASSPSVEHGDPVKRDQSEVQGLYDFVHFYGGPEHS